MPDVPESWIVESMRAVIDLANILLFELSPAVHSGQYVLTNIKIDGVCRVDDEKYADGTELALFDARGARKSETIVMGLNGYWQLAANPGEWTIELGGHNSRVIYKNMQHRLVVASFALRYVHVMISFNPGMEGLKVFDLSVHDTSNATKVNVFSVASGRLYEQLLKIMMVAVRRRSQYSVKFWIIKTFLSPQFKATLPIMSKNYNFEYQLVSYKRPSWLRPQFEKQRIIWGNKILFLDVLFPLELDRVIYIDSDQVVRTDLIELMRMDFDGAPYAFTPFCDSRPATEPFRFWKQGYWQKQLAGKKNHISALFAIDLPKFRQLAVGDLLRGHYQLLSLDPNSLSNLDQDLPNYAQVQIPIYSLPQEWLWCETWCSDETMDQAKTIDLCNNPLTKAPKLFIAQTRIAEWPGLDAEVRNISAGPDEYEKFFFSK
jgi:UDP-glucose:glycoprotein glucosyltransferase